jgi:hypothetical protein
MKMITRGKRRAERGQWKAVLYAFLFPLLLCACGETGTRFHLEGKFKNINQGEFYLCDFDNGTKDTISLRDGRFTYDKDMTDTVVLTLIFPNFSELPIIATPGGNIKMEGDVSHLKETEITGTEENELLTGFRLQTKEMMPPAVKQKAEEFILKHPASPVSLYLLRRYFIMAVDADYARIAKLSETMLKAKPNSIPLIQLHKRLKATSNLKSSGKLPKFRATDTNGKTVSDSLLRKKANVIMVWASWSFDSQQMLHQLNRWKNEHHDSIGVISICMDADACEGRKALENDSIKWPDVCDGKMWDSPLVSALGISFIPENIVIDKSGNIVGRHLSAADLKDKVDKLLRQK